MPQADDEYRTLNRASWDVCALLAAEREPAEVVQRLLKPGRRLFIREGHPMLWALADPLPEGRIELGLPYFEHEEPLVWDEGGTYVETDVWSSSRTTPWSATTARRDRDRLLEIGLALDALVEHDSVP